MNPAPIVPTPLRFQVLAFLRQLGPLSFSRIRALPELRWLPGRELRHALSALREAGLITVNTSNPDNPVFTAVNGSRSHTQGGNQ
jgi:DNA-binding transcriptional ArsR family regulator